MINGTKITVFDEIVTLKEAKYSNGRLAITSTVEDKDGFVEPFGTLTTNVIDAILGKNEIIIKDWSENVEFAEACFATGLFENTGRTISTGHVEAPVWRIKGE